MKSAYKKHLLLGASCIALGFVSIPQAKAQSLCPRAPTAGVTCPGTESRLVQCRDFRDNIVDESYCATIGMRPAGSRTCDATCPPPPPTNWRVGDGGGSRQGDGGDGGGDPLIFDLDGNGISLVTCADGVMFDIDNDGTLDQTGWVDGKDGLLAIDENGNGRIDNQSELFGNIIDAAYQHLANADSNNDGVINDDDDIWDDLVMWIDRNKNGETEPRELKTMEDLGMESIDVGYDTIEEINANHRVTAEGTFTRVMRGGERVVNRVVEVFLDFFSG